MKIIALIVALLVTGCAHLPPGGASEVRASFGVAGVFKVDTEKTGIKITEKRIIAASSSTDLQILLFVWRSSAKDVVLTNPAPDK